MLRINRLLTIMLLLSLILSACQPIARPSDTDIATSEFDGRPETPRQDAPTYGVRGPFVVGTREFVIEPDSDRPLPATIWYPAVKSPNDKELVIYNEHYPPMFDNHLVAGSAVRDALPDATGGPYPLVIFSTGLGVSRLSAVYYVEHLASYGFVVIAPDHTGTTFSDRGNEVPFWPMYVQRPQDILRTIAFAEALTGRDGVLAGLINTDLVAVTGISSGTISTLAAAGARLDLNKCLDPAIEVECGQIKGHEVELAKLAGLEAVPDGPWPAIADPRVHAIIPIVPDYGLYGIEEVGVTSVQVPVMILGAGADTINPVVLGAIPIYEQIGSAHKSLVVFENGWHAFSANDCSVYPWMASDKGWGVWFCTDPVWDMQRAHDLTTHFATAFLLAELKGDSEAAKALAPENVTFPGIQYETTGFGANAAVPIQSESGLAEVNGTRLYYEMAGAGEPIVMIHGLGWDTRDWDAQFAEFAKQYQVVRYDMRGFGKSDMPTDQPYSHADDLKALLDYLGVEPAHLFGHSFGGEIAINFALTYPEATRSLVLIEPDIQGAQGLPALTSEEEASFAAVFAALEKGDRVGAALAIVDIHPLITVSKDVPGVRELILSAFTDYQWFQFLNEDPVVQPEIPSAERIGEITAPTLLVVGDSTTEFQKIEVDRLAEQLPNAEKVVFENSDHFPHLLYPEKFNALVLDFLAKLASQPR